MYVEILLARVTVLVFLEKTLFLHCLSPPKIINGYWTSNPSAVLGGGGVQGSWQYVKSLHAMETGKSAISVAQFGI